jgi:hypothetical protein
MGAQEPRQAGHAAYIAAVGRSIESRGIRVTDVMTGLAADGRREAALQLFLDETAFPADVPGAASASWDEEDGWSVDAGGGPAAGRIHKGLGVVPGPEDVAAWVVVLLAHPELTPSREDHPFRDHRVPDPVFEAQLASYAPGT